MNKENIEEKLGINVFTIQREKGGEGLKAILKLLDIEQLRLIARNHALDHTHKSYTWKNKKRLIDYICQRIYQRSIKGDVFCKDALR